jgi:uncharacterized protein YrrD
MFKIGENVYTTDGQAGKLMKIVINPETGHITHLIVEKGFLQKTDRVVPIEAVTDTTGDDIRLTVSTAELEQLPEFNQSEFRTEDPGWERDTYHVGDPDHAVRWDMAYGHNSPMEVERVHTSEGHLERGVDTDERVVSKGMKVYDYDGELGVVETVLVDEVTAQMTHLVVKHGFMGPHIAVPMSAVTTISEASVSINLTRDEAMALAGHKPAAE